MLFRSVVVDDVIVAPFTRYTRQTDRGGEWYIITGDAPALAAGIPFLRDDEHTWATTGGVTGKNQRQLVRAFPGQSMPTTGATLIADP